MVAPVPLLSIRDLHTVFRFRGTTVPAVAGVSFDVNAGESVGIVGESGCGKSVLCCSILGLLPSRTCRIEQGSILFEGIDTTKCTGRRLREIRGNRAAMVFQDPMTSLNPYLRIGDQLIETLMLHSKTKRAEATAKAIEALTAVGVPAPARRMRQYPHELSGGMCQRAMIAMALLTNPSLLIADEPTTALDVTVQAQILDLLRQRQAALGMAVIFVTHNLAVAASLCHRIMVMYAGRIMEISEPRELYHRPRHPYTEALQRSVPRPNTKGADLYAIPGQPPDLSKPIIGCPFVPRCGHAKEICSTGEITLKEIGTGRRTACARVQRGEI